MDFVTGLDPLGLQNPSTRAYSYLLPGLNNVTSRIRSYTFYCWLLEEFAHQIKNSNPAEQQAFIRKAEYIVALIAASHNIQGVAGSLYAYKQVNATDTFDLQSGTYSANGSTQGTYWQYSFGVLGQYYIGSLRQIGLLEDVAVGSGTILYRCTKQQEGVEVCGEDLARAFDAGLTPANKKLFMRCLADNTVTSQQLTQLKAYFTLTELKPQETELLLRLLLDMDEPRNQTADSATWLRKQTLFQVLQYIEQYPEVVRHKDRAFTFYAYQQKDILLPEEDECLFGWYYYQFNEFWQYACTAILNGSLSILETKESPQWIALQVFIQQLASSVVNELPQLNQPTLREVLKAIEQDEFSLYKETSQAEGIKRVSFAFALLFKLYEQNQEQLQALGDFSKAHVLGSASEASHFFLKEFSNRLDESVESFIRDFFLSHILYRHQRVAYRKMSNGNQSTQKFMIEDGYIRYLGSSEPGFTGPRIGNLIAFMEELHLLERGEENYRLTGKAKTLLSAHGTR